MSSGWHARRSPTARRVGSKLKGQAMLMRFEAFRESERITEELLSGLRTRQIPVDAYRRGDEFKLQRSAAAYPE